MCAAGNRPHPLSVVDSYRHYSPPWGRLVPPVRCPCSLGWPYLDSPRPPGQFFLDLESAASAWPSASRSPRHHRIVRLTSSTGCSSSEGAITGPLWFGGGGVYGMGEHTRARRRMERVSRATYTYPWGGVAVLLPRSW